MSNRFRPNDGDIFADAIPFYYQGKNEYHVFYLRGKEHDNRWPRWKTCWAHIKSTDLINWEELPNALEIGEQRFPDGGACYTGSCIEKDGIFHIFYTGFCPGHKDGREQILHAVSTDLVHFVKDPGYVQVVEADGKIYRKYTDFRDPFVFWNEDENKYFMLVTANDGDESIPYIRSAVTALYKSDDLLKWSPCPPIYKAFGYPAHEVNEVFKIGNWWYLTFTGFKGRSEYRMSKSIYGPWQCPKYPELDLSTHFYGAKGLTDKSGRRLLFGWCGTAYQDLDDMYMQWGGDMPTPRELVPGPDGELEVRYPKEYLSKCKFSPVKEVATVYGEWINQDGIISCNSLSSFSAVQILWNKENWVLELNMKVIAGCGKLGIAVNCDDKLSQCYYINFDNAKNQFEITKFKLDEDVPLSQSKCATITRPIVTIGMGNQNIQSLLIVKNKNIVEVFIENKYVATARFSEIKVGNIALFAEYVVAEFSDIKIAEIKD